LNWIESFIVAPMWGMLSAHLFVQSCTSVLLFAVALAAIPVHGVPMETKILAAGAYIVQATLFFGVFWLGHFLAEWIGFESQGTARVVYWLFAGFSTLYVVTQIPAKVRKVWRYATIPGALESDTAKRRMGLNPESD
jgi:hypothetical protein